MEPSRDYPFGYCTNVHAGVELDQTKANLLQYATSVRERVVPGGRLPVGLWLAESAAMTLIQEQQTAPFADWLAEHHFLPYTFNGFPQGNFHQPVVKHAVYEPTWTCESRLRYTQCLAEIMEAILPSGSQGSISTLPLGWPHAPWHAETYKLAADNLLELARFLDRLSQKNACEVVVAIEPEPGCVLNTGEEIVDFFEHYLFSGPDAEIARRHLTVCHDICHSGVMFESQRDTLKLYLEHGIRVGKVQVSSAVHVPWDELVGHADRQRVAWQQLRSFNEPRYLHQTTTCTGGKRSQLWEDLPQALKTLHLAAPANATVDASVSRFPTSPWRVHFHVPIFVDRFGELNTTRSDISEAIEFLQGNAEASIADRRWFTGHYEVETYAWPVLPAELQAPDLAAGIAQELEYLHGILK